MTDPNDTHAAPDLDDRAEQGTEIASDEAETDKVASEWSQDETDDSIPYVHHSPVWRRLVLAAAWGAVPFLVIGGSVLTLIGALKQPPVPPVNPPVKSASEPLEGTYRVDRYRGEGTIRAPDGKISALPSKNSTVETDWWAFRSACPSPSCIAAGTQIDNTIHTQIATPPAPDLAENQKMQSLHLANGKWVSDAPSRTPHDCAAGMPGQDMWRSTVELMQLPDGELKGQESDSIESNECGRAGTVVTTPIVATRIGDLPAGLPPLKTK